MGWKKEAKFVKKCRKAYHCCEIDRKEQKKRKKFLKNYGFSYSETWNLDTEISLYLLPRIAFLREHAHGIPGCLCAIDEQTGEVTNEKDSEKQWNDILKTIVKGLHYYLDEMVFSEEMTEKKKKVWKQAKTYLAEYYEALWD